MIMFKHIFDVSIYFNMSLNSHQFRFVSAWPPANLALAEGCRGACETEVNHTYDLICQHGK